MSRRMIIMLAVVGVVLGGVFGFQAVSGIMMRSFFASQGQPPQTVSAAKIGYQNWQPQLEAVGTLRASNGADLASEVSGTIAEINFKSGDEVTAGTMLLRLNAQDDVAKLRSLEAAAELAAVTHQRSLALYKKKFLSKAALDTAAANLKSARAQAAEQQAIVNKKMLRAPFAGRLGLRAVDVGQMLNAGTSFVTLQALDPMLIDFLLPQQALDQIKAGQPIRARVDTYPSLTFTGEIAAINAKVDIETRNVQVRAAFANPERKLLPGMYATLSIDTGAPQRLLTLPQTAITFNPYGSTIFVVEGKKDADGKPQLVARQTFVTTGARRGDIVAVLKGVQPGATVVTSGQLKLQNDTPVVIDNGVRTGAVAARTRP
jgi:membrane fusion protein (multidrug efflux system)